MSTKISKGACTYLMRAMDRIQYGGPGIEVCHFDDPIGWNGSRPRGARRTTAAHNAVAWYKWKEAQAAIAAADSP